MLANVWIIIPVYHLNCVIFSDLYETKYKFLIIYKEGARNEGPKFPNPVLNATLRPIHTCYKDYIWSVSILTNMTGMHWPIGIKVLYRSDIPKKHLSIGSKLPQCRVTNWHNLGCRAWYTNVFGNLPQACEGVLEQLSNPT